MRMPRRVTQPKPGTGTPLNDALPRAFNNLSVPGFTVADVLGVSMGNPLQDVILRGRGTVLSQALSLSPTTTLVWVGNSDALSAVTSGIVLDGVTLTPAGAFETSLRSLVNTLTNAGSHVLLVTVNSEIDSIPFVGRVPNVVIDDVTGLPVLVNGETVPLLGLDGALNPGDKVLLPATAALSLGRGIPVAQGGYPARYPGPTLVGISFLHWRLGGTGFVWLKQANCPATCSISGGRAR